MLNLISCVDLNSTIINPAEANRADIKLSSEEKAIVFSDLIPYPKTPSIDHLESVDVRFIAHSAQTCSCEPPASFQEGPNPSETCCVPGPPFSQAQISVEPSSFMEEKDKQKEKQMWLAAQELFLTLQPLVFLYEKNQVTSETRAQEISKFFSDAVSFVSEPFVSDLPYIFIPNDSSVWIPSEKKEFSPCIDLDSKVDLALQEDAIVKETQKADSGFTMNRQDRQEEITAEIQKQVFFAAPLDQISHGPILENQIHDLEQLPQPALQSDGYRGKISDNQWQASSSFDPQTQRISAFFDGSATILQHIHNTMLLFQHPAWKIQSIARGEKLTISIDLISSMASSRKSDGVQPIHLGV